MSNIDFIHEEQAADIGNFTVGRLLPFRQKRSVGPFVFIDHMGPVELQAGKSLDIGPHPHIGLSTLTYLFEGAVMHRDSVGSAVEITPGAVNWMTAGKGVVHSERTPLRLRNTNTRMHGLQIWVALPKEFEDCEPSFTHINADDIPRWQDGTIHYKLIAGSAFGKKSPVPVYSPLYMLELTTIQDADVDIGIALYGESGLYILQGSIIADDHEFGPKQILITKNSSLCKFRIRANSIVYIFGGVPFAEQRFIHWNFVSSDPKKIEQAREDWKAQRFPKIEGETDFIPLPETILKSR